MPILQRKYKNLVWRKHRISSDFSQFPPLTTRNESIAPKAASSTAKKEKKQQRLSGTQFYRETPALNRQKATPAAIRNIHSIAQFPPGIPPDKRAFPWKEDESLLSVG
jgi:hypothetical protein